MIYLGADHGGYKLKEKLKKYLDTLGLKWEDKGNVEHDEQDDYPIFASAVAEAVSKDSKGHLGILVCRSGAGVTIVANKHKGVLAGLGISGEQVALMRGDEDLNILTIASDYTDETKVKDMVKSFTGTNFSEEERHKRRSKEIEIIENKNFK